MWIFYGVLSQVHLKEKRKKEQRKKYRIHLGKDCISLAENNIYSIQCDANDTLERCQDDFIFIFGIELVVWPKRVITFFLIFTKFENEEIFCDRSSSIAMNDEACFYKMPFEKNKKTTPTTHKNKNKKQI